MLLSGGGILNFLLILRKNYTKTLNKVPIQFLILVLDESETVKSKKKVVKKDELCGTCKPARKLKRFKQYLKAEYGE